MQIFSSRTGLLAAAAIGLTSLLATQAGAQTLRIPVGDLSTPDAAQSFDRQVTEAAARFCDARYRGVELDQRMTCASAVREEALAQITPTQREALEAARPGVRLAMNGR
jgi:UrcA family protein